MMLILPVIGAIQHFWWGWPWWPVVIPAHAVTAFGGVIIFNLTARTSPEASGSQHSRAGEHYLERDSDEDDGWDDDDWDDDEMG